MSEIEILNRNSVPSCLASSLGYSSVCPFLPPCFLNLKGSESVKIFHCKRRSMQIMFIFLSAFASLNEDQEELTYAPSLDSAPQGELSYCPLGWCWLKQGLHCWGNRCPLTMLQWETQHSVWKNFRSCAFPSSLDPSRRYLASLYRGVLWGRLLSLSGGLENYQKGRKKANQRKSEEGPKSPGHLQGTLLHVNLRRPHKESHF